MVRSRKNSKPISDTILQAKSRKCLKCNAMFQSLGIGNRICGNCKKTAEWLQPSATEHHSYLQGLK